MRAILTVVVVVLLSSCGLKDDLYLPEAEPAESAESAKPGQSSAIEANAPTSDESEDATNP